MTTTLTVTGTLRILDELFELLEAADAEAPEVDLGPCRHDLDTLQDLLEGMDGAPVNQEQGSKRMSSAMADINRKLLYCAHLADVIHLRLTEKYEDHGHDILHAASRKADTARINMMSHYHRFKGEEAPFLS